MPEYSNHADPNKSFLKGGVITINSLPTYVMACGEWIYEQKITDENTGQLIILFPGNPGVITFYEDFMCKLYENMKMSTPIWGVSHVGQTSRNSDYTLPIISGNEEVYDLEGQILHKMAFLKFVPQDTKLILIGHSIGCYIIIELMKRCPKIKVEHAYLLFPTIERLSLTPNGERRMLAALPYVYFPALLVIYFFGFLRESWQRKIISWYLGRNTLPECVVTACLSFCNTFSFRASITMLRAELKNVSELDVQTISENIEKITFYYGSSDDWCPISYYEHMKDIFPRGDIKLCTFNFNHAFVLESSIEMADMVATWISKS